MDFWSQNGAKLAPKSDQKSMSTSEGDFSISFVFPKEKQSYWRSKGSKLGGKFDQKSIKNGSQNGMHLGMDF